MLILLEECECGHNNLEHTAKVLGDLKVTYYESCNECGCLDFRRKGK